jgi:hypothetical protein
MYPLHTGVLIRQLEAVEHHIHVADTVWSGLLGSRSGAVARFRPPILGLSFCPPISFGQVGRCSRISNGAQLVGLLQLVILTYDGPLTQRIVFLVSGIQYTLLITFVLNPSSTCSQVLPVTMCHIEERSRRSFEMRRVDGRGLRMDEAIFRDRTCSGSLNGHVPPAANKGNKGPTL